MNAKYPLRDLLRVRQFREDKAARRLTQCREQVEHAEHLVAQRKQELVDYIQWREAREEELYKEVFKHEVKLKKLDDLKIEMFFPADDATKQILHAMADG